MKAVKIGHDKEAEAIYQTNLKAKISALEDVLYYCSQFIPIEDKDTFTTNISKEFERLFTAKYLNDFPPIGVNKMYELLGVDIGKVKHLEKKYNSIQIEGFKGTKQEGGKQDFSIYATNEDQLKKYEYAKRIVDLFNEMKSDGFNLQTGLICNGLSGLVSIDFGSGGLRPNYYRILNKHWLF